MLVVLSALIRSLVSSAQTEASGPFGSSGIGERRGDTDLGRYEVTLESVRKVSEGAQGSGRGLGPERVAPRIRPGAEGAGMKEGRLGMAMTSTELKGKARPQKRTEAKILNSFTVILARVS